MLESHSNIYLISPANLSHFITGPGHAANFQLDRTRIVYVRILLHLPIRAHGLHIRIACNILANVNHIIASAARKVNEPRSYRVGKCAHVRCGVYVDYMELWCASIECQRDGDRGKNEATTIWLRQVSALVQTYEAHVVIGDQLQSR